VRATSLFDNCPVVGGFGSMEGSVAIVRNISEHSSMRRPRITSGSWGSLLIFTPKPRVLDPQDEVSRISVAQWEYLLERVRSRELALHVGLPLEEATTCAQVVENHSKLLEYLKKE